MSSVRHLMGRLTAGLVVWISLAGPIEARVASIGNMEAASDGFAGSLDRWPQPSSGVEGYQPVIDQMKLAFGQIIRIGPRPSVRRPDRCEVIVNGNIYYSEAITEKVARQRLAAITSQYARCYRKKDFFR